MFYLVFLIVPILLLLLFAWKWPRRTPLLLLICPLLDFLTHAPAFFYYESRGLILFCTAVQIVVLAIPALPIWLHDRKRNPASKS